MASTVTATSIFRRTSIVKSTNTSPHLALQFLINKTESHQQKGRKSFLNRDEKTLEKLVNLTKGSVDGETVATTANSKGHYVFTATDKANVMQLDFFQNQHLQNKQCDDTIYFPGFEKTFRKCIS